MKKSLCFKLLLSATILCFNSPTEAFFGSSKKPYKDCKGNCDDQVRVCSDPDLASWCKKECSKKIDADGRAMNGVCFGAVTEDTGPDPKDENKIKELEAFRKRALEESLKMIEAFKKNRFENNAALFGKYTKFLDNQWEILKIQGRKLGIYTDSYEFETEGKYISNRTTAWARFQDNSMNNQYEIPYRSARESFITAADLIFDFVYWAQKQVPQTGFKTIKPGTSKKEIDRIFSEMVINNK